jgi:hypothetical protein
VDFAPSRFNDGRKKKEWILPPNSIMGRREGVDMDNMSFPALLLSRYIQQKKFMTWGLGMRRKSVREIGEGGRWRRREMGRKSREKRGEVKGGGRKREGARKMKGNKGKNERGKEDGEKWR